MVTFVVARIYNVLRTILIITPEILLYLCRQSNDMQEVDKHSNAYKMEQKRVP